MLIFNAKFQEQVGASRLSQTYLAIGQLSSHGSLGVQHPLELMAPR